MPYDYRIPKSFASVTEVTFDQLSEEDIRFYVEHYRPMDKAGSYGVQEWIGFIGVTEYERFLLQCNGASGTTIVSGVKEIINHRFHVRSQ